MSLQITIVPCQKAWQRELAARAERALKPILTEQPAGLRKAAAVAQELLSGDRQLKKLRVDVESSRYGSTRVVVARPYANAPELTEVCLYLTENPEPK